MRPRLTGPSSEDLDRDAWGHGWRYAAATWLAAPYGATVGIWTSPRLALYAAVKLPLVMLATAALTLAVAWVLARLVGWRLPLASAVVLMLLPLAVASVILLALSPVSALFMMSSPAPDATARWTHNLLFCAHTFMVGAAATAGIVVLRNLLLDLVERRRARTLLALWFVIYAVVGGEVAWAFRPFVGSIYEEVRFLRPNALDGNVYEFLLQDIVPYLAARPQSPATEPSDPQSQEPQARDPQDRGAGFQGESDDVD